MRISDWSSGVCSSDLEKRARWLADTDTLTGFLNRRALLNAGQALIAEATAKGRQVALFLLDLDHFKTVNDIHGHIAGDRVLQIAAERSEEHTSERQSLMRTSSAVFSLKKNKKLKQSHRTRNSKTHPITQKTTHQ